MAENDIQPELVSLRDKLASEIQRDEKQLELLKNRMDKNRALLHAVNGSLGAIVNQKTGYGSLVDTLKAAINAIDKVRFTAPDIERQILLTNPTLPLNKTRVRSALWNLIKRGHIKTVKKGNNQSPAEYERTAKMKNGSVLQDEIPLGAAR